MDRFRRTSDIVRAYHSYKKDLDEATFVQKVCDFFDFIKNQPISESDLNFLIFLANEAGVPQYFDLLQKKFHSGWLSDENIKVITLGALFYEASLVRGENKLHRYQKRVLDSFKNHQKNRFILTAPTSFGKTFLVYEIIQKMLYKNILLVFPSISLLSENSVRLHGLQTFQSYKIHSLSEEEFSVSEQNIFIFTPERFLSFMDSHPNIQFDFAFIDEIYKIDNSFINEQDVSEENERDIAYRLALDLMCRSASDMLLAGPYMRLQSEGKESNSFNNFVRDNRFSVLSYNNIEIVSKKLITIKNKYEYEIDGISIQIDTKRKEQKILNLLKSLSSPEENSIVYCGRKSDTEKYTKSLLQNESWSSFLKNKEFEIEDTTYGIFLDHLKREFGDDWVVYQGLKKRIGIHHGLIPKYVQKEIIRLFNKGVLLCLFATTTITEGVNTSAKNIIVLSEKKGKKPLLQFDAKNIAGRAGRFLQHYSGRVVVLDNSFEEIINKEPEILGHKNYDLTSHKSDVDFQITDKKYLSRNDLERYQKLQHEIQDSGLPDDIFYRFRIVSPQSKLRLYHSISNMNDIDFEKIKKFCIFLKNSDVRKLDWDVSQLILNMLFPIIGEKEKLKGLILNKPKGKKYSLIIYLLNAYLNKGFMAMVDYKVKVYQETKDRAIRETANYIYNVFKYHLVKYLGLFDVFFRYCVSKRDQVDINQVVGLGRLLQKLEYNALSPIARKISDYGVPFKLIDCYETDLYDESQLDSYERHINQEIKKLFDE